MGSSTPKINIIFSPGFLAKLCSKIELARSSRDDDSFVINQEIKQNLFDFSGSRELLLSNGRPVSEEMFNKVYADLLMNTSFRNEIINIVDKEIFKIECTESLILLNTSYEISKQISIQEGILVSNSDTIIENYKILTFNRKFNIPFQINPIDKTEKIFNYNDWLSKYRVPINKVVVLDPYLYKSDNETIKLNLIELIKALFTGIEPSACPTMYIKIVTSFPNETKIEGTHSLPGPLQRKDRMKSLKQLLDESLINFTNVKIKVICIDLYELKSENSKIWKLTSEEKKKGKRLELTITQSKIKKLFNFCKIFIHDRWFYTNYYLCDSGRGFSPLLKNKNKEIYSPYWTKFNLFSLLQSEHLNNCRDLEIQVKNLEAFMLDPELSSFFYSA